MAQVNVTISGRAYRMACEDGQEEYLAGLAQRLDQAISHLATQFGDIGELRLAVMAAISLADQLSETERRLAAAEAEIAGLRERSAAEQSRFGAENAALAERLAVMAGRLEALAKRTTDTAKSDG